MSYSKTEQVEFWKKAKADAISRRLETVNDLETEKNPQRREILRRIISDDDTRLKIAQDFIFMLQPSKGRTP